MSVNEIASMVLGMVIIVRGLELILAFVILKFIVRPWRKRKAKKASIARLREHTHPENFTVEECGEHCMIVCPGGMKVPFALPKDHADSIIRMMTADARRMISIIEKGEA